MSEERHRWIELIKSIRQEHGISLFESERMALRQPEWRRWVERQINHDVRCRRMARFHLRERGSESLIYEDGGLLRVR